LLRLLLVQAVFGVGTWMGEGEEGDGIGMGLAKGVEVRGVRGAGGDGLGRRLVALRPFCAGDTVACSAPMVRAVNDVHRQVVCHGCLDVLPSTVVRCKGCAVGYCSMECARGAKREHKAECAAVRALENAGIADGRGLCLFASLLDRARRGEKTRKRGGGDDEFSAFLELQAEVGDEVKSAEYAKTARGLAPLVGLEDATAARSRTWPRSSRGRTRTCTGSSIGGEGWWGRGCMSCPRTSTTAAPPTA